MYLKESEVIKYLLDQIISEGKKRYDYRLKLKRSNIGSVEPLDIHKDYKNGQSSSLVEVDIELMGWSSFSDDQLESFIRSIIDEDDNLYPIVDVEIFDLGGGGKRAIKLNLYFVYTGLDAVKSSAIDTTPIVSQVASTSSTPISGDKKGIISEIELKLAEIYNLLNRLKEE